MQHALQEMLRELDPEEIERDTEGDRGIASLMGSRKARLWDAYQARWQAKAGSDTGGLVEAFMLKFAKFYDREGG
jgi:type VI secretion system protein ImpI